MYQSVCSTTFLYTTKMRIINCLRRIFSRVNVVCVSVLYIISHATTNTFAVLDTVISPIEHEICTQFKISARHVYLINIRINRIALIIRSTQKARAHGKTKKADLYVERERDTQSVCVFVESPQGAGGGGFTSIGVPPGVAEAAWGRFQGRGTITLRCIR